VNSLSDICDAFAPQELRDRLVLMAGNTPNLDYLLLTKRPQNYNKLLPIATRNMWGGTTVGVKKSLARIEHLRNTYFPVKFLSVEPLLEDLGELNLTGISWCVIGCESGSKRRPMKLEWAESIVDQFTAAEVAVFVKQLEIGGKVTTAIERFPASLQIREFPGRWVE
jgi:protein gp37